MGAEAVAFCSGRGVKEYRCYFVNRRGGIGDVIAFLSLDDAAAEKQARDHFGRQNSYPSFEIWEKARLVYRDAETREKRAARG